MSLPTPRDSVETRQTALQTKAKHEPATRFYSLWDKVCRKDTRRTITWNGANRIEEIKDNGHTDRYVYDATGRRICGQSVTPSW
ncbi:MAG: hypothetical protein M0Z76_05110 [Gammaproteobacteria bacterium]|nr:hypothetical protein [Gammaproteobacteria bacterium]